MAEYSSSEEEERQPRRQTKKGGRIIKFQPTDTTKLMASPLAVSCFRHMGCFEFCQRVETVNFHQQLTKQFILNL